MFLKENGELKQALLRASELYKLKESNEDVFAYDKNTNKILIVSSMDSFGSLNFSETQISNEEFNKMSDLLVYHSMGCTPINFTENYKGQTTLSKEQIHLMRHALGIEYAKHEFAEPNKKYRPAIISYRNYYQIKKCLEWDALVEYGYAKYIDADEEWRCFYLVTPDGIEKLRSLGYIFKIGGN